jgi:hypothetical protein
MPCIPCLQVFLGQSVFERLIGNTPNLKQDVWAFCRNCKCTCPHFKTQEVSRDNSPLCKHICAVTNQRLHEHQDSLISCNLHALIPAEITVLMQLPFSDPPEQKNGDQYILEEILWEDSGTGEDEHGFVDGSLSLFFVRWRGYKGACWEQERVLPSDRIHAFRESATGRLQKDKGGGKGGKGGKGSSKGGRRSGRGTDGSPSVSGGGKGVGRSGSGKGGGQAAPPTSPGRGTRANPAQSPPPPPPRTPAPAQKKKQKKGVKPCTSRGTIMQNLSHDEWGIALSEGKGTTCKASKRDSKVAPGHSCALGTAKGDLVLVTRGTGIHHPTQTKQFNKLWFFCALHMHFDDNGTPNMSFPCPQNFVSIKGSNSTMPQVGVARIEDAANFVLCDGVEDNADPAALKSLLDALKFVYNKPVFDRAGAAH